MNFGMRDNTQEREMSGGVVAAILAAFVATVAIFALMDTKRQLKEVCSYFGPPDVLVADNPKSQREAVTAICSDALHLGGTPKDAD